MNSPRNYLKLGNVVLAVFAGLMLYNQVLAADNNRTESITNAPIVAGKDYTVLTAPGITNTPLHNGKVNVKEFFSFTCIHCKEIDPLVETQLNNNKKIELNKIQVVWDNITTEYAKLDATIQSMDLVKLYAPAFTAIFAGQNLADMHQLKQFLIKNGLTKRQVNKFMITYASFGISTQATHYKELTSQYNIIGTPTFIVANKYVVSPALPDRVIAVVLFLVNKQK